MLMSNNALTMLVKRYKAVLKKCHILNMLSCAVVAGTLVLGGMGVAEAATTTITESQHHDNNMTVGAGDQLIINSSDSNAIDYTLGSDTSSKPEITKNFKSLTINGGTVSMPHENGRINCGAVIVNSGTLYSIKNIHAGLVTKDSVNNGLRAYSITING